MTEQLEYKPDFERARRSWDALWNHDIVDRPCTLVTAARVPTPSHLPRFLPVDGDFEKAVFDCEAYLESHIFLGEAMPAFRPGFGPDQMAAFLGAPLTISEGSNPTSWSQMIVTDWDSEVLHRIQDAGKIIILHLKAADVKQIHGEYGPAKIVYDVKTDTVEEGLELLDWLVANT
jgi:hypothetical protein